MKSHVRGRTRSMVVRFVTLVFCGREKVVDYRPVIEAFINAGGTTNGSAGLP